MEQRIVYDLSQRATRVYVSPCHAWGESFPGPALKPLRQLTLLDLRPASGAGVAKKPWRARRHARVLLFGGV